MHEIAVVVSCRAHDPPGVIYSGSREPDPPEFGVNQFCQVRHGAVIVKEGVTQRVLHDDLPSIVDIRGITRSCRGREQAEVNHRALCEQEGVGLVLGSGRIPDDLPPVVDALRLTGCSSEGTQIHHGPVGIEERMVARVPRQIRPSGDLAAVVDTIGFARRPPSVPRGIISPLSQRTGPLTTPSI